MWQRIDDNAKAWELMCAGLLWHGFPDQHMIPYDVPLSRSCWDPQQWLSARFDGTDARPNYILLED